jgi:four helix bundle protein
MEVWRTTREVTAAVYTATEKRRSAKGFGWRDQVRRAAGSIMHNVAAGFDAGSNAEFIRFLNCAKRSCTDVQSELHVALDQRHIVKSEFATLYEKTGLLQAKIGAFIKCLQEFEPKQRTGSTANREP